LEKKKLRRFAGNEEKASQKKNFSSERTQHKKSLENNESLSKILLLLSFSSGGC
jgi:hypothetical protein